MNISHWPIDERSREKLLSQGAAKLSDAELLAIFLGCGSRGQTAVDLGRRLPVQSGGLRALFVRTEPLPQLCGLGPAKACRLQAVLEVARRCLGNDLKRKATLRSPRDTACAVSSSSPSTSPGRSSWRPRARRCGSSSTGVATPGTGQRWARAAGTGGRPLPT